MGSAGSRKVFRRRKGGSLDVDRIGVLRFAGRRRESPLRVILSVKRMMMDVVILVLVPAAGTGILAAFLTSFVFVVRTVVRGSRPFTVL
jgi:hypothetical protein